MERFRAPALALLLLCPGSALADRAAFVFFGDWGMGNAGQRTVAAGVGAWCATSRCDFALSLGDNFYPAGVRSATDPYWKDRFHSVYDFLKLDFYVVLGNHDYYGRPQAQVDYRAANWILPSRYHAFRKGDVAFFAIDTNRFDAAQGDWLDRELQASDAPWKVVYGHHPIYSYGQHGDTEPLKRDLLPRLLGRADFYLAGHDHDKQWLRPEGGLHFAVVGTGAETRPVGQGPRTLWARSTLGFGHLDVDGERATLRFLGPDGSPEHEARVAK